MEMKDYVKKIIFIFTLCYAVAITFIFSASTNANNKRVAEVDRRAREYQAKYERTEATLRECRDSVGSIRECLSRDEQGLSSVISRLQEIARITAEMEVYLCNTDWNLNRRGWNDSSHNEKAVNENAEE
jgi:septal ring factor EnvC (AmiA/AmiB activator)